MDKPCFVSFGCWNNGGCITDTALSKVMLKLKLLNPPPTQIFVAGDNYYPEKVTHDKEKRKIFKQEVFESGFKCLPTNIPIYMNYGNHDYENKLREETFDGTVNETCILTQSETKIIPELPNHQINLQMFQRVPFGQSTLVIMIDTTMYDNNSIDEYKNCYEYALINKETGASLAAAKSAQVTFMDSVVQEIIHTPSFINIVIIGHHPIIHYKIKEKKDKKNTTNKPTPKFGVKTETLEELALFLYQELFLKLKEKLPHRTFIYHYLCADLHQYQSGDITIGKGKDVMMIRQYIAGTGGANKDMYDPNLIESHNKKTLEQNNSNSMRYTYSMRQSDITNSKSVNGFLRCEENENHTLHFQFYNVSAENTDDEIIECDLSTRTGGYKKHTHTQRSRKKLNKKTYKKLNKKKHRI